MKNKESILNREHFVQTLESAGYVVTSPQNTYLLVQKEGDFFSLTIKEKYNQRSRWSRAPLVQLGFLVKKPYELLYRHERVNSEQLTVTFGKTLVDDVVKKVNAFYTGLKDYYAARVAKKNADDLVTDFLVAEAAKWSNTTPNYPKGFVLNVQETGTQVEQNLFALGVNAVYYSFKDKKFILTNKSLGYDKRIEVHSDYSEDVAPINILELEVKIKHYRAIFNLIEELNEN